MEFTPESDAAYFFGGASSFAVSSRFSDEFCMA